MRPVVFQPNYVKNPAGSCLAQFGDTKVLCTCSVEDGSPPYINQGGWLTAEYAMLPGSVSRGRKPREGTRRDGRSVEIQRLIGRSLRSAVDLQQLPAVTLTVDCDVLQADGGTRTAAISGGWVALMLALRSLAPGGYNHEPESWALGQVAAVSVGIVDGAVVCDLDYQADSRAEVDMNVVFRNLNLVEVQGAGEKNVFDRYQLNAMLDAAEEGLDVIHSAQRQALDQAAL